MLLEFDSPFGDFKVVWWMDDGAKGGAELSCAVCMGRGGQRPVGIRREDKCWDSDGGWWARGAPTESTNDVAVCARGRRPFLD